MNGGVNGVCDTGTEKFKQWNCHKCLYDPRTEDDMRPACVGALDGLARGQSGSRCDGGVAVLVKCITLYASRWVLYK